MHEFSLHGKTAFITGASRGIGRAVASLLAQSGALVGINYHNSKEQALQLEQEIISSGQTAYLYPGDVSNKERVEYMITDFHKKTGRFDILVNNAGVGDMNYLSFMSESQWDRVLNVNLKGAFLCSKYAAKIMMRQKEGVILNISSIAARYASVKQCNYVASKAGLVGFTQSLAKELGPFGIRVNAVLPGPIYTDLNIMTQDEEKRIKKLIPLGRIGEPLDVANVVTLLCTSLCGYITGQAITVDGGFTA